jgi:hypothetical protein
LLESVKKVMKEWKEYYLRKYEEYSKKAKGLTLVSSQLLNKASEFAQMSDNATDPYTAVNYAFTAAILAEEAYWYDQVALKGFGALVKLSDDVKLSIDKANTTIMNSMTYDLNKLDVLITAASRELKAIYLYKRALNSTNINSIIRDLVMAKYYTEAARTWLQLLPVEPPGPKTTSQVFKRVTLASYSATQGILGYIITLGVQPSPELEEAVGMFKMSNEMPLIYRLASSMYLSAMATYTLHANYNIAPKIMISKVSEAASYDLGLAKSMGIVPYVSYVYVYSAKRLGVGAESLLFMDLASMHALTLAQLSLTK